MEWKSYDNAFGKRIRRLCNFFSLDWISERLVCWFSM